MRKLLELIIGTFFIWFPIVRRDTSRKNSTNLIIGGIKTMSDEEKKAIEDLKKMCIEVLRDDDLMSYDECSPSEKMTLVDIVLNLIKKQSKEIEELKAINKMQKYRIEVIDEREFISKEKIKAKVIEIKNRPVKDEFITVSQGKLNTIIEIESLLEKG